MPRAARGHAHKQELSPEWDATEKQQLIRTYHHLSRLGHLFIYETITQTHHTLRLPGTRQGQVITPGGMMKL